MNKTKQRILDVSRELFNDSGYSHITIRMIALELGMSSGNLNYHFKKREEILEALYFEMVEVFDKRIENLPNTDFSFTQIRDDIKISMDRMVVYKFIWTDLFNILRANAKIAIHFNEAYKRRIGGSLFLFRKLVEKGLMFPPSFSNEYEMLAERMVNFGDTWIYSSEVYLKKKNKKYLENQSLGMLQLIYPYLTKKGQEEFKDEFPFFFK
jgi:AcrR family transcriptional regulator